MVMNLSPQGRLRGITKEFEGIGKSLATQKSRDQAIAENGPTQHAKDAAAQRVQDLTAAQAKNEFSQKTAVINEQINTALRTASGEYKLQLEYSQQLLQNAQNLY